MRWPADNTRLTSIAQRAERATAVTTHAGDSLSKVALKRVRVFAECAAREVTTLPYRSEALKPLRNARMTKASMSALVLGNGPSVKTLDWAAVGRAQRNGLELIVVNWFPLTAASSEVTPDFLVLSDPLMRPGIVGDTRTESFWQYVDDHPMVRLAVPVSWYRSVKKNKELLSRTWFFDDASLEGWTSNTSPLRPRGYLSLTVYKALGIAVHLGYSSIKILGIDNTMYKGLNVDRENRIQLSDHHFYANARAEQDVSWFYPNGVADYFYDLSLCFLHLKQSFGRHREIVNLDPDSLVDCFRKVIDQELTPSLETPLRD